MSSEQRYNQPEKGTTDWHLPLNENFGEIEMNMKAVEDAVATLQSEKANASDVTAALAGKSDTGHTHSGETIAPTAIDGEVVSRTAPITALPGNIYFVPEGSTDPTQADGDLVFYYSTV